MPARRKRGELDVYAYFNNDWEGFAIKNALWLKARLGVDRGLSASPGCRGRRSRAGR